MEARQLRIDLSIRGQQLRRLDRVTFARSYPTADGKSVSGTAVKAALRVIDSHAGENSTCYASLETIAREACLGLRTTKRAIEVLRDTLVLLIEREERDPEGRRWRVHRSVCWSNLEELAEPQPPALAPAPLRPTAVAQSAAFLPVPKCHLEHPQVPPGTTLSATWNNRTSYRTAKEPPPPTAADQAAADLVSLGVEWPGGALEAARSVLSDEQIAAVIAHFRQHAPANGWGVGALVQRLKHARYHDAVERGWPKPAAAAARQAGDRKSALQADEERELERRFGRQLDGLQLYDRDQLAREAFGGDATLRAMYRAGGWKASQQVRVPLLRALAATQER